MTQTVLLGDMIELVYGKGLPQRSRILGEYPVFGSNGQVDTHNEALVQGPGIIVGRKGSVGEVIWTDKDFWPIDTTYYVKLKNPEDDLRYWYYQLKTLGLNKLNSHSAIPGLNRDVAYAKAVTQRSPNDQKKITNILGTIDEKIELNRQMNETLEQMGQALFRHYFIDNPEAEKWEGVRLKDVISSIKQPLKSGEGLADRIYLPIDRLQMKSLSILDPLDYSEAKSSLIGFEKDDILVGAMRVYFHRVNLAPAKGVTRTTTFVLRPNNEYLRAFSTLLINQESTITYANAHSKGSTMPYAIWENGLGDMPIKIPPTEILQVFQGMVWPMLETIRDSHEQIQTLATLRDTLLPRLISGKVKIK